ncbi:hypothetical protein ASPSYDRAFT_1170564 [Aspergillus sydowii CBS 593.65]|uniref:Isopenicillin N synthase-like Fe(2+) 2OG dioxygenase domain-containing protein n=1 Tax=Aspergillus sydowii CBS 593.65 TaxID=1036612 RepID=A0A1L9SYH3_9EURO|nr:uncharacterized protein ASPSYDRAFT_1170564 [Aspergillus sydowii CBS 593.65]OJJ52083.1 hypothetical protein ASPSYDRAFT_1170564 [Aspergillus sydowii CBS 593.65]
MLNMDFRLCDYNPVTAAPESENGYGAYTDYRTLSIIFPDRMSGLEPEDPAGSGGWLPVPGDATVVLTGWCAVILGSGRISAARHRVRRSPGGGDSVRFCSLHRTCKFSSSLSRVPSQ